MYSGTAGEMNYYGVSKLSGDMRKTDFIVENSVKETGKDTNGNPIYAPNDIKVSDAQSYFTRRRSIDESYIYDNSYIKLRELSIASSEHPERTTDKTPTAKNPLIIVYVFIFLFS